MPESLVVSIFYTNNIAELNSLSLTDYENSINNYFNTVNGSNFHRRYFKWFENAKFNTANTPFLNEFDEWFQEFFF
jgi:hypothetical protein